MSLGNIKEHPNYNNRYRTTPSAVDCGSETRTQLSCLEEESCDGHNPQSPETYDGQSPQLPESCDGHSPQSQESCDGHPQSPDPMLNAKNRRAVFMAARKTSCGKMKSINLSTDSTGGDVFVDVGDQVITDPADFIRMVKKRREQRASSSVSLLPNPYNKINHRIHSMFWCSCCLFFLFICCLPAVHNMQSSDKAFREGDEKKAQRLGKMATVMFVAGTLFSLSIYAAILFVVIFFTTHTV